MNTLRRIHLYLGCLFAPLLIFFAVSGIWQTLQLHNKKGNTFLSLLSTIHTSRGLKVGTPSTLTSPILHWVVIAMALCLLITIILGIVMALRFGHRTIALLCLLAGFLLPVMLVLAELIK